MNNVTRKRTTHRGRPRKFSSPAERQKAYRARKNNREGFQVGTHITHAKHGTGIVVSVSPPIARVAFPGPPRCWFELPTTEIAIGGKVRKIPAWADPNIHNPKKPIYSVHLNSSDKQIALGTLEGVNVLDIPVYRRKVKGRSRLSKNYTKAINNRLSFLVAKAKGEKQ